MCVSVHQCVIDFVLMSIDICVYASLSRLCYSTLGFFFFRAEEVIRARLVTGVQTCALPISLFSGSRLISSVFPFTHDNVALGLGLDECELKPRIFRILSNMLTPPPIFYQIVSAAFPTSSPAIHIISAKVSYISSVPNRLFSSWCP